MSSLFGSSGIRGLFNKEVTPMLALSAGKALGHFLEHSGTVIIGTDHRTSRQPMKMALCSGIMASGCDCIDIGIAPTPTIAYAAQKTGAKASISITASHNPPEYNGIKFWNPDGSGFTKDQEQIIEKYILRENQDTLWNNVGSYFNNSLKKNKHIQDIISLTGTVDNLFVISDSACGASSYVMPTLLRKMGCSLKTLNTNFNGFFRAEHIAPPYPSSSFGDWSKITDLSNIANAVIELEANVGIANDGDADRLLVIDETGSPVPQDILLALFASRYLEDNQGPIVTTVDASLLIDEICQSFDVPLIRTPVGDVFVSREIKTQQALFGGESSGTFVFPELHLCPDGIYGAAKILSIIHEESCPLSELISPFTVYPVIRERLECPNDKKEKVMEIVEMEASGEFADNEKIETTDGIRIQFKDNSWILLRPSGTEPVLRISVESKNETDAIQKSEQAMTFIREIIKKV